MSERQRGLTESDRQLLDRLVHARIRATDDGKVRRDADRSAWLDFNNLPGHAEQRLLRSAASALGLKDPYFLVHDGDGGASTVIDGRPMVNFSSYDYLGLNRHPEVRAAARAAIDLYGISPGASRLVAGERPVHRALEAALADHYGQAACVSFVSGHAANVSTIGALLGPRDLVVHDALAHNSIVMGAQLSPADRRSFPHNDLSALEFDAAVHTGPLRADAHRRGRPVQHGRRRL